MIRVVTIEREYGSGGVDIARNLAEKLSWKLWDQLLTDEIARLLDCPSRSVSEHEERKDPFHYRLFKAFLRGSFEGSLNVSQFKIVDADCIREMAERVVRTAADEGNAVIVGRGSPYYLRNRSDSFHVFIYAPFQEKVNRLREWGRSEEEAIQLAETVDSDRAAFIKQYFEVEWPPRHLFHLMINSTIGEEAVVQMILNGIAALEKHAV